MGSVAGGAGLRLNGERLLVGKAATGANLSWASAGARPARTCPSHLLYTVICAALCTFRNAFEQAALHSYRWCAHTHTHTRTRMHGRVKPRARRYSGGSGAARAPGAAPSRHCTRWLEVASPRSLVICAPLRAAPGFTSMTRMPASCTKWHRQRAMTKAVRSTTPANTPAARRCNLHTERRSATADTHPCASHHGGALAAARRASQQQTARPAATAWGRHVSVVEVRVVSVPRPSTAPAAAAFAV